MSLTDELHTARLAYLAACDAAAAITKEHGELRLQVGGNETERRAAQKRVPPEQYDALLVAFAALDAAKTDAIAWRERCEKDLNTLRDLFNRETAEIQHATADRCTEIAHLERVTSARNADTADVYARMAGTRTTMAEIRARYPAAGTAGKCADCGQPLTLDIHDSCVPF